MKTVALVLAVFAIGCVTADDHPETGIDQRGPHDGIGGATGDTGPIVNGPGGTTGAGGAADGDGGAADTGKLPACPPGGAYTPVECSHVLPGPAIDQCYAVIPNSTKLGDPIGPCILGPSITCIGAVCP